MPLMLHLALRQPRPRQCLSGRVCVTYVHCLASVSYHLQCAFHNGTAWNHLESSFRAADLVSIHACCCIYGWAVSWGQAASLVPASVLANLMGAGMLLWRLALGLPGRKADSYTVMGCIFLYTSGMACRGDWANYLGLMFCYGVGGALWAANKRLGGWGHGLFHTALVPCVHCVLSSATVSVSVSV